MPFDVISYSLAKKGISLTEGAKKKPPAFYSAIVLKDGTTVWAEDSDGKTIASGEAGVDDAGVIQSAVDAVVSLGGGRILLKRGLYTLTDSIKLTAPIILAGEGENTILKMADNIGEIPVISIESNNIIIRELLIDGNKDNRPAPSSSPSAACGILAHWENEAVEDVRIINVYVKNAPYDGININGKRVVHINCIVENSGDDGFNSQGGEEHIYIACVARNNDDDGFHLSWGERGKVISCTSYNNGQHGFYTQHDYLTIISCRLYDNLRDGIDIASGSKYTRISFNEASNNAGNGITIEGDYAIVEGNIAYDNGTAGIYVSGEGVKIFQNIIRNTAEGYTQDYAIDVVSSANKAVIKENDVTNGGSIANLKIDSANSLVRNNIGQNMKTVTADYSMIWADEAILADASGGAITITLPDPAAYPNYEVMIKKIDSSTNAVTVAPHGTETIDGASSLTLANQNDAVRLRSDGTNWFSF